MKILGAQDNIEYEPKDFKIKDDFLSKKSIFELKMIQKDLQFNILSNLYKKYKKINQYEKQLIKIYQQN